MVSWSKIVPIASLLLSGALAQAETYSDGTKALNQHNFVGAAQIFKALADQGNAQAQNALGVMYERGFGIPQDHLAALRWFTEASGRGYAQAEANLGRMYLDGDGISTDYSEAFRLFRAASSQGNADAEVGLGEMYQKGLTTTRSYSEAFRLYNLAARSGNGAGQLHLSALYYKGLGVLQDFVVAYMWADLSETDVGGTDFQFAARDRDLIATKLTPDEISQGQAMAVTCVNSGYKQCGP